MISISKAEHLTSFWNRGPGEKVKRATLVFRNNKTAAMLVFQTNPVGFKPFPLKKKTTFFCSDKFA